MNSRPIKNVLRPAQVCQALLSALEASEGRRRRRKRDTTPDAIGLTIKRELLERAVGEDPPSEDFEQWLLRCARVSRPGSIGAVAAMARTIFEEWQMAQELPAFREWLDQGAPSDDADAAKEKSRRTEG